jgi:hypothetical protein
MKMTIKTSGLVTLALLGAAVLSGCSGASSSGDGGDDAGSDGGVTLYPLTIGDSCFDIVGLEGTPMDGCDLGVAALVGSAALPFNYTTTATTATITVGTDGILGGGSIANNMATLVHDAAATDSMMTTCMWHENVTSMVTVTAQNAFTISVVRTQSMFTAAPACTAASIPAGGTCTSSWTWKMAKSTTKTPATMCK